MDQKKISLNILLVIMTSSILFPVVAEPASIKSDLQKFMHTYVHSLNAKDMANINSTPEFSYYLQADRKTWASCQAIPNCQVELDEYSTNSGEKGKEYVYAFISVKKGKKEVGVRGGCYVLQADASSFKLVTYIHDCEK